MAPKRSPTTPNTGNHSFCSLTSESGDDYAELLKRLTSIQEQKWALEEKVNHLETSNACMADDLLQKTAIIEHYVMNSHSAGGRRQSNQHGGNTPGGSGGGSSGSETDNKLLGALKKNLVDLVKTSGGDHGGEAHDMNRKLQLMLEETLTKNMHLQQDLETMSQELVRLSKLPVQHIAAAESSNSPHKQQQQQQQQQKQQQQDDDGGGGGGGGNAALALESSASSTSGGVTEQAASSKSSPPSSLSLASSTKEVKGVENESVGSTASSSVQ